MAFLLPIADRSGYLAGEREIDLVVNVDRPQILINVALSVTQPSAWDRKISALAAAALRAPKAQRVLVAHNAPLREPPSGIRIVEAWRYLLETREP